MLLEEALWGILPQAVVSAIPTTHFLCFEAVIRGAYIQADTRSSYCLGKTVPSLEHHFRENQTPLVIAQMMLLVNSLWLWIQMNFNVIW